MQERIDFIRRRLAGEPLGALCRELGISRKTGQRVMKRHKAHGLHGAIFDLSRRPRTHGNQFRNAQLKERIVAMRRKNPTYGSKTVLGMLAKQERGLKLPARSTVDEWFRKEGLSKSRKRRPKCQGVMPSALMKATEPNSIWAADFKGDFLMGNRKRCYPLTTMDIFSRFIPTIGALDTTAVSPSIDWFCQAFREHGLPDAIRTDNGVPFCAPRGNWGFTRLNVMWARLGIVHERIRKGKPQDNGVIERMHRTLKRETTRPAARHMLAQQERFDHFVDFFNRRRPHQGIDSDFPIERWKPSTRKMPSTLPEPDYGDFDDVKTVYRDGYLHLFAHHRVYLSTALARQPIALRELDDGTHLLAFCHFKLGRYDPSTRTFEPYPLNQH